MADFESVQQKILSFTPIMLPTILLTSTENLGDVRSQSALLRDEQRADRRRGDGEEYRQLFFITRAVLSWSTMRGENKK